MNIFRCFTVIVLMFVVSANSYAQDVLARHTVQKGETITQIAERYRVTPYDIYKLNPDAQRGIREKDILLIPANAIGSVSKKTENTNANPATHTAKPKETLYSISKLYNVTIDELKNANPILSEGLKVGQTIKIPGGTASKSAPAVTRQVPAVSSQNGNPIVHIVEPKETKFGIAKRYGISVAELERQNPGIVQSLQVGYKITITGGHASQAQRPQPTTTEIGRTETTTTVTTTTTQRTPYANYEVKPKETMFSLTQMFGLSEEELIALNPGLSDGVKIGMILKVPGRGSVTMQNRDAGDLTKSIVTTEKKQLVILLPFNASKIQGDSVRSLAERLKTDAFLNMTLDFYSGALMAIDSAKTLGLNVDIKIYDSQESRLSSNVAEIVSGKNLKNAHAVIGPFYQQYAEQVAEMLSTANVPVISPMSKDPGKPLPNFIRAMPTEEAGKRAIFDYMISKNGNIIVISDPKRAANREFISTNYPQARLAELEENGGLNAEKLKAMFVKDRKNYVVLDSERTGMILSTTNLLLNEAANFDIQLAIIEPNETLDFEEISMKRLTILKLLYPSMTRENHSPEAQIFDNAYKRENKVYPSQYAVRGFDVTFDTLLRISQGKEFAATADENKTERVESKFNYVKGPAGGYMNNGVYILQYDEDLTVKEAE